MNDDHWDRTHGEIRHRSRPWGNITRSSERSLHRHSTTILYTLTNIRPFISHILIPAWISSTVKKSEKRCIRLLKKVHFMIQISQLWILTKLDSLQNSDTCTRVETRTSLFREVINVGHSNRYNIIIQFGDLSISFEEQTSLPFWGTNKPPFLRDK